MNTIPTKMRGVYLTGNVGFEKFVYRTDIDIPRPKAGEVLVKIVAQEFLLKNIAEAQKAFLPKTLVGKILIDVTAE